jgi:carbon monoxide dehydrogenase subunit G
MGLRFEHVFVVRAPADRVWSHLTDPYRVAPALPGAAVTEKVDDRTYKGTITVEMLGLAQDTSGRGGAELKMSSRLVERVAGETEVSVVSEVNVTGILAQFGRGMIQDVSNQMFQTFTEAVRRELEQPVAAATAASQPPAPQTAAPPIEVVSFGSQIVGRAAGRALRRPLFWATAAVVAFAIWWLWLS